MNVALPALIGFSCCCQALSSALTSSAQSAPLAAIARLGKVDAPLLT